MDLPTLNLPLSIAIPAIIVLIVFSCILSLSETAFVAVSKGRMHRLAKKGDKRAKLVKRLQAVIEKFLSSLLLCNTLVNFMAGTISGVVFLEAFGEAGLLYSPIVMTIIIAIYAEVMPKMIAVKYAEVSVLRLARPLSIVFYIASPIIYILQNIARLSLRLVGVRFDRVESKESAIEELRGAIDLHDHPGAEEISEERAMLHSILDLDDVEVSEIMIHRKSVMMIDADLPTPDIVKQVTASPYTRIPLWQGNPDNVVGVLHVKALLRALKLEDPTAPIDVLAIASPPWFIPESTTLREQLQAFRARQEHFALVVDEYGVLLGVVTLEDIIEEIVGEISDEHDLPLEGVWVRRDGSIVSDGGTTIRDLNRKFDWALPDEEAATIAGLILHESRIIPTVGQTFLIHGFSIKILKRTRNQITLVSLTPTPIERQKK